MNQGLQPRIDYDDGGSTQIDGARVRGHVMILRVMMLLLAFLLVGCGELASNEDEIEANRVYEEHIEQEDDRRNEDNNNSYLLNKGRDEEAAKKEEWYRERSRAYNDPSTYDCDDFISQRAAQQFYEDEGGPYEDRYVLDEDQDGLACEMNR